MSSIKKFFGPQDMTDGSIFRRLAAFSIPLLLGNVMQQLYNTVDAVVVGRFVGDDAIAAVGACFPIMFLMTILFMGIATGASIMVSQYFGARDRDALSKTIGTTMTLTFATCIIIMIAAPIIIRPLLTLIKTPDNVIDMCTDYLIIIFVGILGMAFYNGISGTLRGMGDSLWPLAFLTFTCILNILLDIWFVAGFGWGVAGVAWATVISQWISCILCFWRLLRKNDVYEIKLSLLRPNKELSFKIARLGLPAAATQIVFSLANILVQALTNTFGSDVMASLTIVMRVDSFAVMPMFSFGMAISTFVGQNVGANKLDRVEKGVKAGLFMILTVTFAILTLIFFFGRMLMHVFTDTPEIVELSNTMLRILIPGYIGMAISQILFGVLRGSGDTVSSMWISIITTVVIRTPLAYFMAWMTRSEAYPVGRPEVLVISLMAAWFMGAVLAAIVYRMGGWRNKAVTGKPSYT